MAVAIASVRKSKQTLQQGYSTSSEIDQPIAFSSKTVAGQKFCTYCGATNKSFAIYCEKCGKKISFDNLSTL